MKLRICARPSKIHAMPPPQISLLAPQIVALLLLILLIKSKLLRIKMSLLGSVLGFAMLVGFVISTGLLTLLAGGAVAYAAAQSKGGN